jgi:hypothetical protein
MDLYFNTFYNYDPIATGGVVSSLEFILEVFRKIEEETQDRLEITTPTYVHGNSMRVILIWSPHASLLAQGGPGETWEIKLWGTSPSCWLIAARCLTACDNAAEVARMFAEKLSSISNAQGFH